MVFTTPGRPAVRVVHEPTGYRVDGATGARSFAADVFAAAQGATDVRPRLDAFVREQFVSRTDAAALAGNTVMAPYVPQIPHACPMWTAVAKPQPWGERPAPFFAPSFNTGGTLIDDARTEGTEPTGATLTTTGGAVTPLLVAGKLGLTRELWDQHTANAALDAAMWGELENALAESLEGRVATALAAVASPTTLAVTAASTNATLLASIRGLIAPLAHVRGGSGMRYGFTHAALHQALANAVDSTGRPLLEDIADGQGDGVIVSGRPFRASFALSSFGWLLDPRAVAGWASAPRELEFGWSRGQVATTSVALLSYAVVAVQRSSSIRKITY